MITEIGGTVGDIESLPFLEAIRQFPVDVGRRDCMFIHLTLVPYIGHAGELKTKPTQHSVNELRRIGIQPDMLICRSEGALSRGHPQEDRAVREPADGGDRLRRDVDNIYKVPLTFHEQGVDDFILEHFGIEAPAARPRRAGRVDRARRRGATRRCGSRWSASTSSSRTPTSRSSEALRHAASAHGSRVEIDWVDSETLERRREARASACSEADGILIPGGFGGRGIEGKIARGARRARAAASPTSGICLGMQSRSPSSRATSPAWTGANSTEFDVETPYPVIDLLPEQKEVADLGGTMRLGADPIKLHDGTRAREIYGEAVIYERHRHRYEVNNLLRKRLRGRRPGASRAPRPTSAWSRSSSCRRRAPVLRRLAVPPRVQVAPRAPRAAVPRLRRAPRWQRADGARPRRAAPARSLGAPRAASAPTCCGARCARASEAERRRPERDVRRAVRDREPVRPRAGVRRRA